MNFTVFSKNGCSYCEKVKKILELTSSKFVVYNLGEHFNEKAFIDEFGHGSTFPVSYTHLTLPTTPYV